MMRHYHVEQAGDQNYITGPVPSFRKAKSEAAQMVGMARRQRIWKSWGVEWSDPTAGYHRWLGTTRPSIGDFTDTITVIPCREVHP